MANHMTRWAKEQKLETLMRGDHVVTMEWLVEKTKGAKINIQNMIAKGELVRVPDVIMKARYGRVFEAYEIKLDKIKGVKS